MGGNVVSPDSVTVPKSEVMETSLSGGVRRFVGRHEQQLRLAARLHIIGGLRGPQMHIAQRDVPDRCRGAVYRRLLGCGLGDLSGAAAGEGGRGGQPAGRQGHGDSGTARFEAVHPEASCSAGEAPVTWVASDKNPFDYAQ